MHCVDLVATAATQKNDHIQTKIYAAPPMYLLSKLWSFGVVPSGFLAQCTKQAMVISRAGLYISLSR